MSARHTSIPRRHKAPIFKLEPNKLKILAALVFLIKEAERRSTYVTQYMLVKSLFLADRSHLNTFGRPIAFDNYVAMEHGPVPSFAYKLLRGDEEAFKSMGMNSAPWTSSPLDGNKKAQVFKLRPLKSEFHELSESDFEALTDALTVVCSLSFTQLRKLTHEDPAYVDAWEDDGPKRAYPMSYGLMFDAPDYDQAENVALSSRMS